MPPRGVKKGTKRARQYEHIKDSLRERGTSEDVAEEIAARTVNKERARHGEAREPSRLSQEDISSGRRGGLRSHRRSPRGRTKDQLYEEARSMGIKGRSRMNKAELERAVSRKRSGSGRFRPARPRRSTSSTTEWIAIGAGSPSSHPARSLPARAELAGAAPTGSSSPQRAARGAPAARPSAILRARAAIRDVDLPLSEFFAPLSTLAARSSMGLPSTIASRWQQGNKTEVIRVAHRCSLPGMAALAVAMTTAVWFVSAFLSHAVPRRGDAERRAARPDVVRLVRAALRRGRCASASRSLPETRLPPAAPRLTRGVRRPGAERGRDRERRAAARTVIWSVSPGCGCSPRRSRRGSACRRSR